MREFQVGQAGKKKILLVYPPYERFRYGVGEDFPIGLGHLATVLNQNGYKATIYNADQSLQAVDIDSVNIVDRTISQDNFVQNALNDENNVWIEMKSLLEATRPDLVGVYTSTVAYPIVLKILRYVKELDSQCVTILGGPHVTLLPDEIMTHKEVDFILMGEAEYTLVKLCDSLSDGKKDFKDIAGLGYRSGDEVIINREYNFIENLDELSIVDRKTLLNWDKFPLWTVASTIIGSRGCPYRCTFCSSSALWKHSVRYRSIEHVMEELKYLKQTFNIKSFAFWDDIFFAQKSVAVGFCKMLIREKLGLTWTCSTRANLIDDELVSLMKRSHCTQIALGVESGSDRVLEAIKKDTTVNLVRNAVKLIRRHGLRFCAAFIVGLPYEKEEDIRKTISLIREIKPDSLNVSTFFPYPGTEAYAEVVKLGLLPEDFDWSTNLELGHHSFYNCFSPHISPEVFKSQLEEILILTKELNKPTRLKKLKSYWQSRRIYMENPGDTATRAFRRLRRLNNSRV